MELTVTAAGTRIYDDRGQRTYLIRVGDRIVIACAAPGEMLRGLDLGTRAHWPNAAVLLSDAASSGARSAQDARRDAPQEPRSRTWLGEVSDGTATVCALHDNAYAPARRRWDEVLSVSSSQRVWQQITEDLSGFVSGRLSFDRGDAQRVVLVAQA